MKKLDYTIVFGFHATKHDDAKSVTTSKRRKSIKSATYDEVVKMATSLLRKYKNEANAYSGEAAIKIRSKEGGYYYVCAFYINYRAEVKTYTLLTANDVEKIPEFN